MHPPVRAISRRRGGRLGIVIVVAAMTIALAGCAATEATDSSPPATSPGTTATSEATTTTVAPTTASTASTLPPLPDPSPALSSPGDNRVLVVGDSVILGAAADIPRSLIGWNVIFDARESRFVNNGVAVLQDHKASVDAMATLDRTKVEQAYADAGRQAPPAPPVSSVPESLGRVVVIHLCTNYQAGGGFEGYIDSFMRYLDGVERVVWVTCGEWSPGQTEANDAIRAAATRHPSIVIADWAVYASGEGFTYEDGIHLTETGRAEIAEVVAAAVGPAPTPNPPPLPTTLPAPTSTIPPSDDVTADGPTP